MPQKTLQNVFLINLLARLIAAVSTLLQKNKVCCHAKISQYVTEFWKITLIGLS